MHMQIDQLHDIFGLGHAAYKAGDLTTSFTVSAYIYFLSTKENDETGYKNLIKQAQMTVFIGDLSGIQTRIGCFRREG